MKRISETGYWILDRVRKDKEYFPLSLYDRIHRRKRVESSKAYWLSLKGKYKGFRGFVIGNGPSLKMTDLDLLENEFTIASNKIFLAFESVKWRPSFYTVGDPVLWPKIRIEVSKLGMPVHVVDRIFGIPVSLRRRIQTWGALAPDFGFGSSFSNEVHKGIYDGGTVTFQNLQIASHLGLNPIYLIGCDHFYSGEDSVDVEREELVSHGNVSNHFVKNYRTKGEVVNPANIRKMTDAYCEAEKFAKRNGVSIYNATRGGHLEVFERVDFNKLFS